MRNNPDQRGIPLEDGAIYTEDSDYNRNYSIFNLTALLCY